MVRDHYSLLFHCSLLSASFISSLHTVRLDVLLWGIVQEGRGWASGGGEGGVYGGRSCGGGGRTSSGWGAGGVTVAQEASWGGGIRVLLLKGCLGVLGVGRAVVQVWAGADRGGYLSGQHQAGLHKGLWVDVRLRHPADRQRPKRGGVLDKRG